MHSSRLQEIYGGSEDGAVAEEAANQERHARLFIEDFSLRFTYRDVCSESLH